MAVVGEHLWCSATVVEATQVAREVTRLVLEPTDAAYPRRVAPGAHLDVRVPLDGRVDVRSYSVVDASGEGPRVALSVHRSATSRGGSRFMTSLGVGDVVEVTRPLQNFPLGVGADRYVLLAGGIGITALAAMAATLRARQATYLLVYAGRSRADMAYVEDLSALHGERLRLHVADEGTRLDVDALLDEVAAGHGVTELYLCGPIRLMDAVREGWAARGLPPTDLRFETFGNSGSFDAEPFLVRVPRLGVDVEVPIDVSILDALTGAGVEVMSDCRRGECGLCLVDVIGLDGRLDHRDVFLSATQRAAGANLCVCVSRAVGPPSSTAPTGDLSDLRAARAVLTIDIP